MPEHTFRFTPADHQLLPSIDILVNGQPRATVIFRRSTTEKITDELNGYARLAAAAPDLLDALRQAMSLVACDGGSDDIAWNAQVETTVRSCRAAASKAMGCDVDRYGEPVDPDPVEEARR